jgi:hypothetical protein
LSFPPTEAPIPFFGVRFISSDNVGLLAARVGGGNDMQGTIVDSGKHKAARKWQVRGIFLNDLALLQDPAYIE